VLFDLACVIALIAAHRLYATKTQSWLFWIALLCGLGLFAIRLHGLDSWWTGHWNYDWRRWEGAETSRSHAETQSSQSKSVHILKGIAMRSRDVTSVARYGD